MYNTNNHYDTIIVGGGIAGLTAGIYSARSGQSTLILEGELVSNTELPGGQLSLTPTLENFPGWNGAGFDLIDTVREQAESFGAVIIEKLATEFEFDTENTINTKHTVRTSEQEYTSKSVILATGAVARRLGIEGEDRFYGHGVSSCATCDGAFFKGQNVAVIGGGDTAVEDALYLSKIASHVTLIHRRDQLRTNSPESRQLLSLPNVRVIWNTETINVQGESKVTGLTLKNKVTNEEYVEPFEGIFVAIGHDPAVKCFHGTPVEIGDDQYLIANDTYTNIAGVFGAGDVVDSVYRQAITASATGAMSAMNAIKHNQA